MSNIYLKHVLDHSIRGAKEVHTRDASHLCLHSTGRQVLLSEAWNHEHHVQGGVPVFELHREQSQYRGGGGGGGTRT